ncbi:MAG: GldG family protein, partial [Clostridia bacterium]|nr:GldG family protein [Clostridia bacterium]
FHSFDFSEDKIYSVSDYTKKLLSQNNNSFTVYFYKSGRLDNIYPSISNVSDFLRQYEKVSSEVSLKIIDCDKNEKARELLSGYGIFPERIKTVNSTSTEFIDVYSAVVIEGQGNIEVIPFVLSPSSLEYQLDLKILNLCGYKPFVNILSGDGQKLDDELRLLKDWFTNQGISVYEADTDSLYKINGPLFVFGENNFSFDDSILIENYMNSGKGNVLFCTSPYSVNIKGDWSLNENKNTYITQMLAKYGIEFNPSIVFDYSCRQISLLGDSGNKNAEIINYPMWISVLPQKSCRTGLSCFWASPLSLSENAVPYIYSSEKSFEVPLNFNNPDVLIETNPFMINLQNVQTNALQNKVLAAFVPLYSAECTDNVCTKSGFYVIADSLFASFYTNGFIGGENGDFRNFMFLTSLFWKMNGMNELASLQEKTSVDRSLYKRSVILK